MVTLLGCRQARTPAPLFSICASEDFWDILFPNVLTSWGFIVHANRTHPLLQRFADLLWWTCRVPQELHRLDICWHAWLPLTSDMRSGMSSIPWEEKSSIAFWRGTDRGAVNWDRVLNPLSYSHWWNEMNMIGKNRNFKTLILRPLRCETCTKVPPGLSKGQSGVVMLREAFRILGCCGNVKNLWLQWWCNELLWFTVLLPSLFLRVFFFSHWAYCCDGLNHCTLANWSWEKVSVVLVAFRSVDSLIYFGLLWI